MKHFLTTSMKNGVVDPFHETLWEQQAKLIRTKKMWRTLSSLPAKVQLLMKSYDLVECYVCPAQGLREIIGW